jgi:hypothetical protein
LIVSDDSIAVVEKKVLSCGTTACAGNDGAPASIQQEATETRTTNLLFFLNIFISLSHLLL